MKIVTPKEMARIESLAYDEGAKEEVFMENAGLGVATKIDRFCKDVAIENKILLLCAKGNNSGDAYVAGVHLLSWGYSVTAIQIVPWEDCSPLCKKNHDRFLSAGGYITQKLIEPHLLANRFDLIVDGMFGTGFKGEAKEPYHSIIKGANESSLPIIAIDIPSGLNGETGVVTGQAIKAAQTIFLGLPKQGFFLADGWNYVGLLEHVFFGLDQKYIDEAQASASLITPDHAANLRPRLVRNRHKYQAGYVMGVGGSPGMPGAALLASLSALKAGAGMMRLLHPEGMQVELSASPYELIKIAYRQGDTKTVLENINKAGASFFGPGIGRDEHAVELCKSVLPHVECPCVIDADALSILSEEKIDLPKETLMTPHCGEMARLLGEPSPKSIDNDFLERCQKFADQKNVTLILKGGPSWIFHPGKPMLVNPTGTPGMATAGSGDVLTGILAALISQGLTLHEAAIFGVYLHGLAGEIAALDLTPYCMLASDIIEALPKAYWEILE